MATAGQARLPYARAVRATLCKPQRALGLLDVVAEVVGAADAASGAAGMGDKNVRMPLRQQ